MDELKLVIFDCDGVMFDSKDANLHYYNHLRQHFGHPDMDSDELEYVHTHHVMDSLRYIFRLYPEDLVKADQYRKELDYTPYLQYMKIEPDLIEFLQFIRPKYKTAISTNRTTTMSKVLELFHLQPYFDMVVTALDVTNPKPHPEALHSILGYFGLRVDEAIFIGDSTVDLEHTASICMRLIAFKNPTLPARYHVNSFTEILNLPYFAGLV